MEGMGNALGTGVTLHGSLKNKKTQHIFTACILKYSLPMHKQSSRVILIK